MAHEPTDQAVMLLSVAGGAAADDDPAHLPLGERDRRLIELWSASFGDSIPLYGRCPSCAEESELALSSRELLAAAIDQPQRRHELIAGRDLVHFRLPDSADLRAVGRTDRDVADRLLERCVLEAWRDGEKVSVTALSDDTREAIGRAMAAADPMAEIDLAMSCPACGHAWTLPFDVVTVLWARVEREAKNLLQQVDALARVYGWREHDVLALSAARRALYLEMVL